ncbi:MAG: hypothetical protein Q9173_005936, partial [Seirophora scorigena]
NFARVEYPQHASPRTDAYVRAAGIGVSKSERWADADDHDKHEGGGGEQEE